MGHPKRACFDGENAQTERSEKLEHEETVDLRLCFVVIRRHAAGGDLRLVEFAPKTDGDRLLLRISAQ